MMLASASVKGNRFSYRPSQVLFNAKTHSRRYFSDSTNAAPVAANVTKTEQNSNQNAESKVKVEKSYSELKIAMKNTPPKLMRVWYALGIAGVIGAIIFYFSESDEHERRVNGVIRLLKSPDIETRKLAFAGLEACLFEEKKLLTTVTQISKPKSFLVQSGCVEALFQAFSDGDSAVKENVMVWLIRLADDADARKRILRTGIAPILAEASKVSDNAKLWLMSASLLSVLSKYPDTVGALQTGEVVNVVSTLQSSNNPIAKLVAAQIFSQTFSNEPAPGLTDEQLNEIVALSGSAIYQTALRSAMGSVIPKEPVPWNPALGGEAPTVLWRAVVFGFVGNVWGRIRWRLRASRAGIKGKDLKKFVNKKSRVGTVVFSVMIMDLAAEALMLWPDQGIIVPYINQTVKFPELGVPRTTSVPVAEALLVTMLTLRALRSQRYVVFPLMLAMSEAHWATIDFYTKPYLQVLGIDSKVVQDYLNILLGHTKKAITGSKD